MRRQPSSRWVHLLKCALWPFPLYQLLRAEKRRPLPYPQRVEFQTSLSAQEC